MELTNKQRNILILIATLAVVFLILLWIFFINKSTVIVSGPAPFTIDLGGLKKQACVTSPCSFNLPTNTYTFKAVKDGYLPDQITIKLKIRGNFSWKPNFVFIPKLAESQKRNFVIFPPTSQEYYSNANDISFLIDEKKISKAPNNFNSIIFSFYADSALLTADNKYYLLDLKNNSSVGLNLQNIRFPHFDYSGQKFFFLEKNTEKNEMSLKSISKDLKEEVLSIFLKPINVADFDLSPSGKYISLKEQNSNDFYFINTDSKTRHKITLPNKLGVVTLFEWSQDDAYLLLSDGDNSFLFDTKNETFNQLKMPRVIRLAFIDSKNIAFIEDSFSSDKAGDAFVAEATTNTFKVKYPSSNAEIIFGVYDIESQKYNSQKINIVKNLHPKKMETKDRNLYLLSSDNDIYEIKLKP